MVLACMACACIGCGSGKRVDAPAAHLTEPEAVPFGLLAAVAACEADLDELESDHQHVEGKGDVEGDGRADVRVNRGQVIEELDDQLEAVLDADPSDEKRRLRTVVGVRRAAVSACREESERRARGLRPVERTAEARPLRITPLPPLLSETPAQRLTASASTLHRTWKRKATWGREGRQDGEAGRECELRVSASGGGG